MINDYTTQQSNLYLVTYMEVNEVLFVPFIIVVVLLDYLYNPVSYTHLTLPTIYSV